MKSVLKPPSATKLTACAAIGAAALLMADMAFAQAIYRIVGPDGKTTFSDKAPAASSNVKALDASGKALPPSGPALPFELRQVVVKYPVTLYTSASCAPCGSGRALLSGRGVPFTEKTVNTNQDVEALQRMSGESSLPFLTIGGQQIKGYSEAEWTQFLNAAGYPGASSLPAGYRNPAAEPLVAVQKAVPAVKPEETAKPNSEPSRPAPVNSSNPAGIKF